MISCAWNWLCGGFGRIGIGLTYLVLDWVGIDCDECLIGVG